MSLEMSNAIQFPILGTVETKKVRAMSLAVQYFNLRGLTGVDVESYQHSLRSILLGSFELIAPAKI